MATQWEDTLQGRKLYGAFGTRDILVIAQDDTLQGPDIVPRCRFEMTENDKQQLQRLGIPLDNWQDDASIMVTRCSMDKEYTLLPTERSKPGIPLSKEHILAKIKKHMKVTMKDGCK